MCEDSVRTHVSFDGYQSLTCDDLIPIVPRYETLVTILHTYMYEDLVPILHICKDLVPILHTILVLHTLKTMKMLNLSTNFTPKKLSKLAGRKFHIYQKWRIGTNSSHGVKCTKCEICGSTNHVKMVVCSLYPTVSRIGLVLWHFLVILTCVLLWYKTLLQAKIFPNHNISSYRPN